MPTPYEIACPLRVNWRLAENIRPGIHFPAQLAMSAAMMKPKGRVDPEREIAHLCDLSHPELVKCWQARHGAPPPKGMSRKLLLLALAYRVQASAHGDLTPKTQRYLRSAAGGAPITTPPRIVARSILAPGLRLVREWNGRTHQVDTVEGGFVWNGETHKSLSAIARAITGARWSGPRFFGLRSPDK